MKPSVALNPKRGAIFEATERFRTVNPRACGSVLHGNDKEGSDLDLLVDWKGDLMAEELAVHFH